MVNNLNFDRSLEILNEAKKSLAGGVNSKIREPHAPHPLFMEKAKGSHIWDVDGNEFIDTLMGFGPIILGYCDPKVNSAVQEQLNKGSIFLCGNQFGKVRAMMNERNQKFSEAFPSDPVQILGFEEVPKAGDNFTVFLDEREAKKIATERTQLSREAEHRRFRKITLDQIGKKISSGEVQKLDIIIKGDVDGSIEAVSDSLMELSTDEVSVRIIHRSVGMITQSDVSLAAASSAAMSSLTIWSIASVMRCALAGSGSFINSPSCFGKICQLSPQRSFSHPHCSMVPLSPG